MNRVCYGLRGAHYALILSDRGVMEYAPPVPLPGAVALSLSPVSEPSWLYSPTGERAGAVYQGSGYDGTLELATIPDDFRRDVLGEVCEGGIIREPAAPERRQFALLFEFQGDAHGVRHVLYNCAARAAGLEGATKAQGIEPKTETLTLWALPDCRGLVKAKTTPGTPADIYRDWFDRVY